MSSVIKVENLSKQYRLGTVGTGTLAHDINRWWYLLRGKEDPYLKIGESNERTQKGESDYVWALRDINFEVKQGEVLGIIGRNGAGKSTLLKILSRTTAPSSGKIKIKGRVASLLEVGTGFHPELTGRENIFLNGAILGMTKNEIARKFDEIMDFAGVEKYIDTPVKRYSSGMYVRLAFAVAAHLEPEILIVDEVLAVGDLDFQKKALGKMQQVSASEGRTVLFVSHSMPAVRNLCNRGLLMENGLVSYIGTAEDTIERYIQGGKDFSANTVVEISDKNRIYFHGREIEFAEAQLLNSPSGNLYAANEELCVALTVKANRDINNFRVALGVFSQDETSVGTYFGQPSHSLLSGESTKIKIVLSNHQLAKGRYYLDFSVGIGNEVDGFKDFDHIAKALFFEIAYKDENRDKMISIWHKNWGIINFNHISITEIK
jgi:lipopolysaccharide transport system ATP-binding protein